MAKKLGKTPPVAVKLSKPAAPKSKASKPHALAAKPTAKSAAKPALKPAKPAARAASPAMAGTPTKKLAAATRSAKPVGNQVGKGVSRGVVKTAAKPASRPAVVAAKAVAAKTIAKPPATPAFKARAAAAAAAPLNSKPAAKAAPKPAGPAAKSTPASKSMPVAKPSSAGPVVAAPVAATPAKAARAAASPVKPGVKNGDAVVAKIALKPAVVAALAAERGTPVMKLTKSSRPRPEPVPVRLPPAPVRSDSKMARNRAGISSRELEHFRDLLFQKRRELTGDVYSMETSALHNGNGSLSTLPMHMADAGTDNYEQEFTLGLVEKDRKLLRDINVALAKIQDGSYGICEGTGKPIAKPRLEAQPWAKYSIEHARALERPQFRRAF